MAKPSLFDREGPSRDSVGARDAARPLSGDKAAPAAALTGQVARFGAAGIANVGVDLSVYSGLLFAGAPIPVAKGAAFVCGTAFAYWANKNWTFRAGKGNRKQFAAFASLYAVSMALNVGANSALIAALGDTLLGKTAAYCGALILSATLNFVGMREILLVKARAGAQAG